MTETELRAQCHTLLPGHTRRPIAANLAAMAAWCETHQIETDVYGESALIQAFEAKIAALLGYPAGVFCITGTLAQMVALHLACQQQGSTRVAMHVSAHMQVHENSNCQLLNLYQALNIGQPFRPPQAKDIAALPDRLGAVLYELPMREIGGQLPSWDELNAIKAHCAVRGTHLHMDGARLWEAATGYGRALPEVCAGFDSCYVSFYKGIGSIGGAMLLGSSEFIDQARLWIKRMGGNLTQRTPYVVSAAMQFDEKLAAMPQFLARTQDFYRLLGQFPRLQMNPAQPQVNLFHLYFPAQADQVNQVRNRIAEQERVWLFGNARATALPGQSMVEFYVGENLLAVPDQRINELLHRFCAELAAI
jgi:threonine aldolase